MRIVGKENARSLWVYLHARVTELAVVADLNSAVPNGTCGFESHPGHHTRSDRHSRYTSIVIRAILVSLFLLVVTACGGEAGRQPPENARESPFHTRTTMDFAAAGKQPNWSGTRPPR